MRNRYFLIAVLVFVVVGPFILPLNTVAEMLIFGIIAVSIPLWLLAPGAGLVGLVATTSTREFDAAEVVKEPLPLTAILVIGLLTGLLAGPVIAVLALVGLLAFGWAIQGS